MPVPTHLRVVFRGIFEGTPETWSFGLKFSRDNTVGADASLSDIDIPGMASHWGVFANTSNAGIPANAALTDVRGYIIGTDGKMEGNPEIFEVTNEDYDGVVSAKYPPQICVCVTHVAANRGPARFGRSFLPTALAMDATTSKMTTTTADNFLAAYTFFVKQCSDEIDLELTQSASQLNISAVGAGARQEVDHHEVGLAFDTLRSRRRALVEERRVGAHIDW